MSGGSHNYISYKLEEECAGEMHDEELNGLIEDLCQVLHDLEWWQSGDISEAEYRNTVDEFKKKWLSCNKSEAKLSEKEKNNDD